MPRTRPRLSYLPIIAACLAIAPAALYAQIPIPAGFPNASNTGIAGIGLTVGDLTPSSGRDVTVAGTVIDMENVSGTLNIKANNVTIRRSRIRTGSYYGVRVFSGYTGTVIEDCLMVGNAGSANVVGSHYTIRRCDISGDHDGIKLATGALVEDSYVHDQLKEAGTHNDAMQDSGGSNGWVVRRNSIIGPYRQSTSAIIMNTNFGPIRNVTIEGNFLSGGGYTVYCKDKGTGHGAPTNVTFRDNVWEEGSFTYNHITYDGSPTFECNAFHTGAPIPQNPPCDTGPTADAGPDQSVTDADGNGFELVQMDGSGSTCPDGTITGYLWTEGGSYLASGVSPLVVLSTGSHTTELKVTADDGETDTDTVVVNVLIAGAIGSQTSWQSFAIDVQTGDFTFEFDATPNAADMNGVIGVGNGVASDFTDLACLFRFSPSGNMDVRNGGRYNADVTMPYAPGTECHVRMEIDISTHTYDVYVTPLGGSRTTLARGYAFRSEQSSVSRLDHWALVHSAGSFMVDSVVVGSQQYPPPTADAGPDQTLADDDGDGFALVVLDGNASTAPPGTTLTQYMWTRDGSLLGLNPVCITGLPVGVHTVTLEVTDSSGAKATDDVVVTVESGAEPIAGDADGDGDVDLDDFVILKANFGTPLGATVGDGDFDGDGDVDLDDFTILKQNFGS